MIPPLLLDVQPPHKVCHMTFVLSHDLYSTAHMQTRIIHNVYAMSSLMLFTVGTGHVRCSWVKDGPAD